MFLLRLSRRVEIVAPDREGQLQRSEGRAFLTVEAPNAFCFNGKCPVVESPVSVKRVSFEKNTFVFPEIKLFPAERGVLFVLGLLRPEELSELLKGKAGGSLSLEGTIKRICKYGVADPLPVIPGNCIQIALLERNRPETTLTLRLTVDWGTAKQIVEYFKAFKTLDLSFLKDLGLQTPSKKQIDESYAFLDKEHVKALVPFFNEGVQPAFAHTHLVLTWPST